MNAVETLKAAVESSDIVKMRLAMRTAIALLATEKTADVSEPGIDTHWFCKGERVLYTEMKASHLVNTFEWLIRQGSYSQGICAEYRRRGFVDKATREQALEHERNPNGLIDLRDAYLQIQ